MFIYLFIHMEQIRSFECEKSITENTVKIEKCDFF